MNRYLLKENYETFSMNIIHNKMDQEIKKYQKLINEIPHWIWETDKRMGIISSNFHVGEITGYDSTEVIGFPIKDFLFSSEFNGIDIDSLLYKLFNGSKQRTTFKHCIRHRDQSIRYLKTVIISNHDSANNVVGLIGITHDQTSQIIAEKALKESENKLQLVLSNLSEIIFMIDSESLITFISPTVRQFFEITPDKILRKSFFDIFKSLSPDNLNTFIKNFKQAIKRQKDEFNYEIEIKINNRQRIFEISEKILYDSKENFKGAMGVIRDITKRRNAEADIRAAFNGAIDAIAVILEQRDVHTSGHQRNVAKLSVAIAQILGLDDDRIEGLRIAATLHDLGKVSIPIEILNRPSKLSKAERQIVEMHPRLGASILKQIPFPWSIAQFVEEHHERIDGSGYPKGLNNNEISLEARIIGVADTLDSIINHRPYKPAQDLHKALEIINNERGIKFDVDVVDAMYVLYQNGFLD